MRSPGWNESPTTSSGCSTRTPRSSACPTTGRRPCGASRWRSSHGRRLSALVWGDADARARAPARRRPERPHLGHGGDGARPAAGGHRPARPRPLRRRPRRHRSTSRPTPRTSPSAIRALAPERPGRRRHVARRHDHDRARRRTRPSWCAASCSSTSRPASTSEKSTAIADFVNGPESFASFDDLLARTIEYNPTRTESSLRRGHPAQRRAARGRQLGVALPALPRLRAHRSRGRGEHGHPDFRYLWDAVSRIKVPVLLVRGMRAAVGGRRRRRGRAAAAAARARRSSTSRRPATACRATPPSSSPRASRRFVFGLTREHASNCARLAALRRTFDRGATGACRGR